MAATRAGGDNKGERKQVTIGYWWLDLGSPNTVRTVVLYAPVNSRTNPRMTYSLITLSYIVPSLSVCINVVHSYALRTINLKTCFKMLI